MRGQTSLSRPETERGDGVGGWGWDSLFVKGSEPGGVQGGGGKRRSGLLSH